MKNECFKYANRHFLFVFLIAQAISIYDFHFSVLKKKSVAHFKDPILLMKDIRPPLQLMNAIK